MKVFLSWSGDLSRQVAVALNDWLPAVLQIVEPYISCEHVDKGARWGTDLARELEQSSFGIICLTPENVDAPWINFEAGALSKSLDCSRVAPLLFGVDRTAIQGPLLQFQSTSIEHDDVKRLLLSLDKACGERALGESRVTEIFEVWWPHLQERLGELWPAQPAEVQNRARGDVLTEILELARRQEELLSKRLSTPADEHSFAPISAQMRTHDGGSATPQVSIRSPIRSRESLSEATHVLGERVRRERAAQGLSVEELAKRCGAHWTFIAQVERGRRNPSLHTLLKIAEGLAIDPMSLMPGLKAPQAQPHQMFRSSRP